MKTESLTHKNYKNLIIAVSIIIPLVVAFLIFFPGKLALPTAIVSTLPHLNGLFNSATSVLLVLAVIMVKSGKVEVHKRLMISCIVLGAAFLVSYVLYHSSAPSTKFGDLNHDGILTEAEKLEAGSLRIVYLVLLLSHILLSLVVLPFVLIAFYRALTEDFIKHKKIVKYAFPIWLFVSVSGVVVYLLIRPYYNF